MSFPKIYPPIPDPPAPGPTPVPAPPTRRRSPKWLLGIPLAVLAAGAMYLHFRGAEDAAATAGGGPEIAAVAVAIGNVDSTVRVSGTIVAERSAIIRAPRIMGSRSDFNRGGGGPHGSGGGGGGGHADFNLTLLRLAKGGTVVKAGDVVAEFDPENQTQRLDDYSDSVVQLKNSIGRMMANLAAKKESHEQLVRVARADWEKAILDEKTTAVRSAIDAEKMRLAVEEAKLKYDQLLLQQSLVEESQQSSIRTSQLVLERSDIELQRARNNVKRMSLTTPIDGVVVIANLVLNGELRTIREGDQVSPGQPVVHVVDTSSMALNGSANQVDAERMRLGMNAAIGLDAYPGLRLPATLIGIGALAKVSNFRAAFVGEIPVRFRINGHDQRLLPDLTGSADVLVSREENVPVAPRPALFTENGQPFVFVRDGDQWQRRPVSTGSRSATHVAIREGLKPGEQIALRPPA